MALWQSPRQLPAAQPTLAVCETPQVVHSMPVAAPGGKSENTEDFVVSLAELLRILGQALHSLHGYACSEALAALRLLALQARCHFEMADYKQAAQVYAHCCHAHGLHKAG